jgi:hypothetical protein
MNIFLKFIFWGNTKFNEISEQGIGTGKAITNQCWQNNLFVDFMAKLVIISNI